MTPGLGWMEGGLERLTPVRQLWIECGLGGTIDLGAGEAEELDLAVLGAGDPATLVLAGLGDPPATEAVPRE